MNFAQAIIVDEFGVVRYKESEVLGVMAFELLNESRLPLEAARAYRIMSSTGGAPQHRTPGEGRTWFQQNGTPIRILRMMRRAPSLAYDTNTIVAGVASNQNAVNSALVALRGRALVEMVPDLWPRAWRLTAQGIAGDPLESPE